MERSKKRSVKIRARKRDREKRKRKKKIRKSHPLIYLYPTAQRVIRVMRADWPVIFLFIY